MPLPGRDLNVCSLANVALGELHIALLLAVLRQLDGVFAPGNGAEQLFHLLRIRGIVLEDAHHAMLDLAPKIASKAADILFDHAQAHIGCFAETGIRFFLGVFALGFFLFGFGAGLGNRGGLHVGGGLHIYIAARLHRGRIAQQGAHVLQRHAGAQIYAGQAVALVLRHRVAGDFAQGVHGHILARGQLALHIRGDVIQEHRHRHGEGHALGDQLGRRFRLRFDFAFGVDADIARGLQRRVLLHQHGGILHRHVHGDGQVQLAAARGHIRNDLRFGGDGAALRVELRAGGDVHLGGAHLDVYGIDDSAEQVAFQQAAALLQLRGQINIVFSMEPRRARHIDDGVFDDVLIEVLSDPVEQILDLSPDGIGIQVQRNVVLVLCQHGDVLGLQNAVQVDLFALDQQVEARGVHIAHLDIVLALAQHQVGQGEVGGHGAAAGPGFSVV